MAIRARIVFAVCLALWLGLDSSVRADIDLDDWKPLSPRERRLRAQGKKVRGKEKSRPKKVREVRTVRRERVRPERERSDDEMSFEPDNDFGPQNSDDEEMSFEADDLSQQQIARADEEKTDVFDVADDSTQEISSDGSASLDLAIPDLPSNVELATTSTDVDSDGFQWNAQLVSWANVNVVKNADRPAYEGVGRIDLGVSRRLTSSLVFSANGRVRYGRDMLASESVNNVDIEPREIYLSYQGNRANITLGNQVIRWGVTDFFTPNDIVNPLDFRDRTSANPDSPHIPVPAIRAQMSFETATLEGVVLPYYLGHRMAAFNNRWGFFAGQDALTDAVALVNNQVGPGTEADFENIFTQKSAPELGPQNVSGGARLAYRIGGFDIHLNGFYGFDRFPTIKIDPALAIVTGAFQDNPDDINMTALEPTLADLRQKRMQGIPFITGAPERTMWFGSDFTFTRDKVVIKGEVVGSPAETVYTTGSQGARLPTFTAAAGFDYTPIQEVTITMEGFSRFLLKPLPRAEDSRFGNGEDIITAGLIRYVPQNGKLSFSMAGTYSILRRDWRLAPRMNYQVMPGLSMAVGASVLAGPENSYGGAYGENDHVFVRFDWLAY